MIMKMGGMWFLFFPYFMQVFIVISYIPGIVPIVISGWPNLAFSPAYIISHIMATSQPPPTPIN